MAFKIFLLALLVELIYTTMALPTASTVSDSSLDVLSTGTKLFTQNYSLIID